MTAQTPEEGVEAQTLVNVPLAKNICTSTHRRPCGYCEACRNNSRAYGKAYNIQDRIADALRGRGYQGLHSQALFSKVFPPEYCPSAYNRPTRGGPAGGAFALGKAIRVGGFKTRYEGYDRYIYMPDKHPKKRANP